MRFCEAFNITEVKELERGMDFRKPVYRREVFLRFYEFHLKYRSHPGGVYQFIPFLSEYFGWNIEQRLWYATLNGMTQHPMTSLALFAKIPTPPFEGYDLEEFTQWFNANWYRLPFDTDRRYQKKECPLAIQRVNEAVKKYGSLKNLYTGDFSTLWKRARTELHSLGRLGAWSGLEFIKIAGRGEMDFNFDTLMLTDKDGSRSHRNGLGLVLGRDDLDWHKGNESFKGYSQSDYIWLEMEGDKLLQEAKERFLGRDFYGDVGFETLESTLCTYKSWHRPNRRYPSVYNDMAYARLLDTQEKNPDLDLSPFWETRKKYLPKELRIEDNPTHPQYKSKTLDKKLQNSYREFGIIPNLGLEWECFKY